jgi:hypothetical protein
MVVSTFGVLSVSMPLEANEILWLARGEENTLMKTNSDLLKDSGSIPSAKAS